MIVLEGIYLRFLANIEQSKKKEKSTGDRKPIEVTNCRLKTEIITAKAALSSSNLIPSVN